jgi:hypothetical protein
VAELVFIAGPNENEILVLNLNHVYYKNRNKIIRSSKLAHTSHVQQGRSLLRSTVADNPHECCAYAGGRSSSA